MSSYGITNLGQEGPCRDFRFGRCNFGDNCKFSHGEEKTASEEVTSWPARPSMRVITAPWYTLVRLVKFGLCQKTSQVPASKRYATPVKHDDVIIVPEFFCAEDDWDTYYSLIKADDCERFRVLEQDSGPRIDSVNL